MLSRIQNLPVFIPLPIFRMAIKGGVVSLSIAWHCNLDYDFMSYCLPRYNFRILDDFGWNFRHAKYHEENRRTLYKMYGIKVRGGKGNDVANNARKGP